MNGKAVWSWPGDGSRMEGSFKRGYAHGPGILYFNDGTRSFFLGLSHFLLGLTNNYTKILNQYIIFPRFEGSFKKGYPNGQGRVRLGNNTVVWEGTFTNGAPDEEVTEELQKLFTHFHTYPLRMKRSLRRR